MIKLTIEMKGNYVLTAEEEEFYNNLPDDKKDMGSEAFIEEAKKLLVSDLGLTEVEDIKVTIEKTEEQGE